MRVLAINANDAARFPADSPAAMARFVADQSWPIPYLHDETQDVARALGAQVTPHAFVLDGEQRLRYRGAPDADHEDPSQNAGYLRDALDAVLAGAAPATADTRPRGCSVKWRADRGVLRIASRMRTKVARPLLTIGQRAHRHVRSSAIRPNLRPPRAASVALTVRLSPPTRTSCCSRRPG